MARGGFTVHARIESESHFADFTRAVEVEVNKALVEWAKLALEEVVAAETRVGNRPDFEKRRVSPGVHLRDSFRWAIEPVSYTGFGAAVVWTANPNAIWQELGTRSRRRKKLKDGSSNFRTNATRGPGNGGVKPLYFMRKGLAKALPTGEALMAAALRNVGSFGGGSRLVDTTAPGRYA